MFCIVKDPFGQSFTYTYYINNPCVLLKSLPLVAAAFSHHSRFPNLTHVAALQPKTVNPLDPRQRFCQYWLRECNLTADNRFCCGLGTLKSANHRAGTPINQSHCGSAGSLNFCESEANPTSHTVKIASLLEQDPFQFLKACNSIHLGIFAFIK